jgi:hypothetical protein
VPPENSYRQIVWVHVNIDDSTPAISGGSADKNPSLGPLIYAYSPGSEKTRVASTADVTFGGY